MNSELVIALEMLEKEKGIKKEVVLEALEAALLAAYKKNFGTAQNVRIDINPSTGDVQVFSQKKVVEEAEDTFTEISLADAQNISMDAEVEDIIEFPVTPKDFGRIAAQNAKQVVVQKIREAERNMMYDEYFSKENDIVVGTIQRKSRNAYIVDIGKAEAVLAEREQVPGERYQFNSRMKFYVCEVKKGIKGLQIRLSRSHPGLLQKLFELEVPEIASGIVEIKSVAREAGMRSKISVWSSDEDVDPIGSCVGKRGARVQAIVDELNGEKLDIVKWSVSPAQYIAASLSPSEVLRVDANEEDQSAVVIVPDDQLSLAIGKDGQNARLAAKLTGWKIDIKSESQFVESLSQNLQIGDGSDGDEVPTVPVDMVEDMADIDVPEVPVDMVEDVPEEVTEEVSEEVAEEAPEAVSEDIAEDSDEE